MDISFQLAEPKALILFLSIPFVIGLGILSANARPREKVRIRASIVIRVAILVLIALALGGLQLVSASGPLNVVFLVDQSASVPLASQDAATQYVQRALQSMGPEDRAGIVVFGENAVVARAVSGDSEWKPIGNRPAVAATDIGEAIQAGVALFPEGGARRLVLLSDGIETAGTAAEQARLAAQAGVQLSVINLGVDTHNEVAVDSVKSPSGVPAGRQFEVRVLVKSTSDQPANVQLFDNDVSVGQQAVQLKSGDNVVSFSAKPEREGFHVFKAVVEVSDDRYVENNQMSSYSIVRKPPSVLIVAGSPADANPLKEALAASNVTARVVKPDEMPRQEESLLEYDAVVLANASADLIGVDGQLALQHFVRDLGHGLIMLGGESSYGAGGYLRSPLEEALPVSMDVRTSEQRASLAMTFVTDKSGSMGRCHCGGAQQFNPSMRTEFGVSKIEIAKQAIAKAVTILNSSDYLGVVGFDESAQWLVNLQELGKIGPTAIEAQLKPVAAEGNTNMYAGLQSAVDALKQTDAKLKHIILLSDGWTRQSDYTALLNDMESHNITLSTVGAGQGADPLLRQLADKGGGQYYAAEDVNTIPELFLRETVRMVGSYYVETPFKPQVTKPSHPILKGLDANTLPRLLGYNGSTLKPSAELIIKSPQGDPILAQWQYGLGRTVAWTPDVKGRWAADWVTWPKFSQFAAQVVGWTFPGGDSPGLTSTFSRSASGISQSQDIVVRVESSDSSGLPRNLLNSTMVISSTTGPPMSAQSGALTQQSPGVYGGTIRGLKEGVYEVKVEQRDPTSGDPMAAQSSGFVIPYPSEYRLAPGVGTTAAALLNDLARLGHGSELKLDAPQAAFVHDILPQPHPIPLWPFLLTLAILLFPLDVAVRRLTISKSDLRLARAIMRRRNI